MPGKSVLLIGPPGSGKTTMAALTAVRRPVHFLDIDRKIASMENVKPLIESNDVTFWELDEPLIEGGLKERARELGSSRKPAKSPLGWPKFSQQCEALDREAEAKRAGTWVVDSMTRLGEHLMRYILFSDEKGISTMSPRDWGAWLSIWQETVTILVDAAKQQDKDIIFTVHERVSEIPGPNTKIRYSYEGNQKQREYIGMLDVKIAASLGGQVGIQIGSYFEEVYGLSVELDEKSDMPKWVCRVVPDGRRDLRTSFKVSKAEFPPDFKIIWGGK